MVDDQKTSATSVEYKIRKNNEMMTPTGLFFGKQNGLIGDIYEEPTPTEGAIEILRPESASESRLFSEILNQWILLNNQIRNRNQQSLVGNRM